MTRSTSMSFLSDDLTTAERKALTGEILRLAMPIFIGGGINALVAFITRVFISELGDVVYNGVNFSLMTFFTIVLILVAFSVGTTTLVAQNWGGNQKERAGDVLKQSILFAILLGSIISILGLSSRSLLLQLLGMDDDVVKIGSDFLFWIYLGLPFFSPAFFMAAALRGAGDTRTPMIGGLVMSIVSLVLTYGLVLGKLGMPRLEAVGAAIAVDLSFLTFAVYQAVAIFSGRTIIKVSIRGWRPSYKTGLSIFKIGMPSAGEWTLIRIGFMVYVSVVSLYGHEALAGFFTGIAILSLTQSLTQGLQVATTTLVGQAVGARDLPRAESFFRLTTVLGFLIMALFGLFFAITTNDVVLSYFFRELKPASIAYARTFIILICLAMPLMGSSFAVGGGLRGAGNTIGPLIAAAIGVYVGRFGFALLAYVLFKPTVFIIWCSMFPDMVIRLIIMIFQVKSGKWKSIKVDL